MSEKKGVMDWCSIDASVVAELSSERQGWTDQLTMVLENLRHDIEREDAELPIIAQIKQKMGELRDYFELPSGDPFRFSALQQQIDRISKTCESCGNAARKQNIQFYVTTLCCWCYNRELKRRSEYTAENGPVDPAFDIAERFPDLVNPTTASLRPSIGVGWFNMLAQRLRQMETILRAECIEPGLAQISDVKTDLEGRISLGWHGFLECLEGVEEELIYTSGQTCCHCGHVGDIVRGRGGTETTCAHCAMRANE